MESEFSGLTREIIGAGIAVHKAIWPGLLESAYQACMEFELRDRGLRVEREVPLPIVYRDVNLDCGYRLDLVVNDTVLIELKSIEAMAPIHEAQMISYLKLSGKKMGLLMNFNVPRLRDAIKRLVNNL